MDANADAESVGLPLSPQSDAGALQRKANRVRWLKLNFTVKAARLQTLKRQKYQHLQEEALLRARGLLQNWENGVVVLTEDLYRLAAGERDAQELMNYTPEALALRFSLRNDPHVLEAVRQLWQIEMRRDPLGCIDQQGYASVFRRCAKSLDAKAFRRKQKVDRLLDEDWKRDSKGESTMSFANFFDSIFELADLWCETIDAEDYVVFLERLRGRISTVRRGKRTFKPLKKVTAFDADSDEEEDEGEEEEEDEEEDEDSGEEAAAAAEKPPPKPVVAPPPQQILVAKTIKPVAQQQQQRQRQPPSSTLRKVSRVAISSKVINTKTAKPTAATAASVATPAVPLPVEPPPVIVVPTADTISPLQHQMTPHLSAGPSRQGRRASVVTTIQFLDDGFVRSVSEGMGGANTASGGGSGSFSGAPSSTPVAMSMAQAAAAASFAAKRDPVLRPSLASAAAAALTRHDARPQTPQSEPPHQQTARQPQQEDERKRVTTVSTSRRSILKSVVFATSGGGAKTAQSPLHGKDTTTDAHGDHSPQNDTTTVVDHHESSAAAAFATGARPKARGGGGGGTPGGAATATNAGIAIRIRQGSLFSLDDAGSPPTVVAPAPTSKGTRIGLPATAAMKSRGGLTPLASPGQVGPVGSISAVAHRTTKNAAMLTAIPQSPQATLATNAGPDFSESVVMTSFVVDRPANASQSLRPVTVLGPPPSVKRAQLTAAFDDAAAGDGYHGGIRGTRAIAKVAPAPKSEPVVPGTQVASLGGAMSALLHRTDATTQPENSPVSHRHGGHTLHGHATLQAALLADSQAADGALEDAMRISAALDAAHRRHGAPHTRASPSHDPYYGHVEVDADAIVAYRPLADRPHGMNIQSFAAAPLWKPPVAPSTNPRRVVPVDAMATPWDTFDDDEDDDNDRLGGSRGGALARNLLQPESATEALAKVMGRRTASLSAGSNREHQDSASSSSAGSVGSNGKRPQSRPGSRRRGRRGVPRAASDGEACDDDDNRGDNYDPKVAPSRSRLLTVASLGGASVERGRQGIASRRSRQYDREVDSALADTSCGAMRESVSSPVLLALGSLDDRWPSSPKRRSRTSQGSSRAPPNQRHSFSLEQLDEFLLRGETAMDPAQSPPRSPAVGVARSSPLKVCTCSRASGEASSSNSNSWPPPMYRLERTIGGQDTENADETAVGGSDGVCAVCSRSRGTPPPLDVTLILNAKRELVLQPTAKELDAIAHARQELPRPSEMMRRRHQYTRGKPK